MSTDCSSSVDCLPCSDCSDSFSDCLSKKKEDNLVTEKDPCNKIDVFNSVLKKMHQYLKNESLDNNTKQKNIEEFGLNQLKD